MPNRVQYPAVRSQVKNRILLALPEHEFQQVFRHLTSVELRQGQVLCSSDNWIDYAYFMNSGMTSSVSVTAEGQTVEDGTVGNEGLMGSQVALGEYQIFCSAMVQIPGNALRIGVQALRYEFNQNAGLSSLLLDYMRNLRLQISQSCECNDSHSLVQRLCRLLLMSQDCGQSSSFPFTYKFLSHIVGASREAVSVTLDALQEEGLIYYKRSRIRIIDRQGMEGRTCGCYKIFAHRYDPPVSFGKADITEPPQGVLNAGLNISHSRSHVSLV
jgi:CRP-like cAMP-binding protein